MVEQQKKKKKNLYHKKIRDGNREIVVSIPKELLVDKNLKVGDFVDIRTWKKVVKEDP